jgi:D-alanine-D-alanine ligase
MKKIAVLMGGTSTEREISLDSGRNVAEALASLGKYEVIPVVLDSDDLSAMPEGVDAVYIALHGGWGENGGVQSALDRLKIPYTGPGAHSSRVAMDKIKTKMVLEFKALPTAPWGVAEQGDDAPCPIPFPVVVKPPKDGSSFGISKCNDEAEYRKALELAWSLDRPENGGRPIALVEEFIRGREATVAVIGGEAYPPIEIVAPGGWYGFEEKYRSDETQYRFLRDGEMDERTSKLEKELMRVAKEAADALGCRGVVRVDFRISPLGRLYILELNTSPGFTSHSLVPKAGMKTGLTFAEVCDTILKKATFGA